MIPVVICVVFFSVTYPVVTDSLKLSREVAVEDVGNKELKDSKKKVVLREDTSFVTAVCGYITYTSVWNIIMDI